MIEHGGNVDQMAKRLGVSVEQIIDFSANINPLGVPKSLKNHILQALSTLERYPDPHYEQAREAIAKKEGVHASCVLLSNGAAQAFFELAHVLKPKKVGVLSPTFLEYAQAFEQVGSQIISQKLTNENAFQWDFDTLLDTLKQLDSGDVMVICNPNNPTGQLVESTEVLKVVSYLAEKKVFVLIDEAFMDFVENEQLYSFVAHLSEFSNVFVSKSMTKFFAIPGLRLGYLLSSNEKVLQQIAETRVPWSVNALSASAVSVLLNDKSYAKKTAVWLAEERAFLYRALTSFPKLTVFKPSVNYILFQMHTRVPLKKLMAERAILIRSCENYDGLDATYFRVAVKNHRQNKMLIEALEAIGLERDER